MEEVQVQEKAEKEEEKAEKAEKAETAEMEEKAEKAEKAEMEEKAEKAEKAETAEKEEKEAAEGQKMVATANVEIAHRARRKRPDESAPSRKQRKIGNYKRFLSDALRPKLARPKSAAETLKELLQGKCDFPKMVDKL